MPNAQYLLQANDKFYPYTRRDLLLISIAENRREGFEPQGLFRLEREGFGDVYVSCTEQEIKADKGN